MPHEQPPESSPSALWVPDGQHPGDTNRTQLATRRTQLATRRRFLLGGLGALAAGGAFSLAAPGRAGAVTTEDGEAAADATGSGDGSDATSDAATSDTATSETTSETATSDTATGEGTSTGEADAGNGLVTYYKRSAWNAYEPYRYDGGTELFPVVFSPIQKVTVHHTATWTPADDDEAIELVQNIYYEHAVIQGMGDIGYHLLIAPSGSVFEGRWSGGTHFPIYDIRPGTWGRSPWAVTAAHTQGYNSGNIGIAMMGDFDEDEPTEAALWALQVVAGMIMANTGIDPTTRGRYVNPISGATITVPNLCYHRSFIETDCPGEALADAWSTIRAGAAYQAAQLRQSAWLA